MGKKSQRKNVKSKVKVVDVCESDGTGDWSTSARKVVKKALVEGKHAVHQWKIGVLAALSLYRSLTLPHSLLSISLSFCWLCVFLLCVVH